MVLAIALIAVLAPVAAHPHLAVAAWTQAAPPAAPPAAAKQPDVIFVPTPDSVVHAMLDVAKVTKDDVVYDLGCGDGRIVIAAAKDYGARGVGIDVDPQRIAEATANAERAGVTKRVKFLQQDLFETDIHDATVVTLYLLPSLNLKLRPKLWNDLKPGTRVVSHAFDMGPDWQPEQKLSVEGRNVFFWTVPKRSSAEGSAPGHDRREG
jgi:SAM-dependent methyltransferase